MAKYKSLQPWLDYFELLHTYEQNGYLEVKPEKHEAYITRAALCTIAGVVPMDTVVGGLSADTRILDTARRLCTYVAYCSASGADYDKYTFALHVVKEEAPHDLLCTLLLTRKRVWWRLWRKAEQVEVITY